jgi:hypothetical protein
MAQKKKNTKKTTKAVDKTPKTKNETPEPTSTARYVNGW